MLYGSYEYGSPALSARNLNRGNFLKRIKERVPNGDQIYILVSPVYDIKEDSVDLGNVLLREHNTLISRTPPLHHNPLDIDLKNLHDQAKNAKLIVYLSQNLCDNYIQEFSLHERNTYRRGHHIEEATQLADLLKKPLVIGYLDNCKHVCDYKDKLPSSGIDYDLLFVCRLSKEVLS